MPQYLSLAENDFTLSQNPYSLAEYAPEPFDLSEGDPMKNYIWVPSEFMGGMSEGEGVYMNVSQFADMPPAQFEAILDALLPYQPGMQEDGLSFLGIGKKAQKWKAQKRAAKVEKKAAKSALIRSRAEKNIGKGAAFRSGAAAPDTIGGVAKSIGSTIGNVAGKIFGGGSSDESALPFSVDASVGTPPAEPTFMQKYGPVLAVVGIGGLILFLATRKKRK